MKSSRLNIVIAFVLAVSAGIAVYVYTSNAKQVVQKTEQVQEVLVATNVIPIGTTLLEARNQGLLETDTYPVGALPNGYLTKDKANDEATAKLLIAQVSVAKGLILTTGYFSQSTDTKTNLGPLQVPAGKFAVAVTLPDADHVGQFVVPGVDVAVFCTVDVTLGGSGGGNSSNSNQISNTRLLVDRVTVIGVGNAATVAAANANNAASKNSNGLITLAADQKATQKIIQCSRSGQVNLSLIGTDTVPTPDSGAPSNDLFKN